MKKESNPPPPLQSERPTAPPAPPSRQFAVTYIPLFKKEEYREAFLVEIIEIMLSGELLLAQDMYEDYKLYKSK